MKSSISPQHLRPWVKHSQRGFTLVEIVLALGIVSFAVVALVGMLSVSMDSSRSSNEDTVAASIARQVIGDLRSQPFDQIATSSGKETFFDSEGKQLTGNVALAAYRCTPTIVADPDYTTNGKVNLLKVRLEFRSAASNKPASRIIQTAVSRYE